MEHILTQLNLISFGEPYKIDVFCGQKLLNKQYTKSANHGTFINWTSPNVNTLLIKKCHYECETDGEKLSKIVKQH